MPRISDMINDDMRKVMQANRRDPRDTESLIPIRTIRVVAKTAISLLLVFATSISASSAQIWSPQEISDFNKSLNTMLTADPALQSAGIGMYIVDSDTGEPLYAHNADETFSPGEAMKVLVASVALETLGAKYRAETAILASQAGNVFVLRAGGDPFLRSQDLQDAAQQIGPKILAGSYKFVDASRYVASYTTGGESDHLDDRPIDISAIALDDNSVPVNVAPGTNVGDAAIVDLAAPVDVHVINVDPHQRLERVACDMAWASSHISLFSKARTGESESKDTVTLRLLEDGCPVVFGNVPLASGKHRLLLQVPDVRGYAQAAMAQFFDDAQASTLASPVDRNSRIPTIADATIKAWVHESVSLANWIGPQFWDVRQDFVAEMLLRELGFLSGGAPGTSDKGLALERKWLSSIGISPTAEMIADASGWSDEDKLSTKTLVAILQHDLNGSDRDIFVRSLDVDVQNKMRAIRSASASDMPIEIGSLRTSRLGIAGYMRTKRHGLVTYAFEFSGPNSRSKALDALRSRAINFISGS